ncbi:TPA: bifunctional methylenetetrahydrofolate dehydrogenase/methenyltetrahydrofolate cyclohydrolase, partial [Candidatus Woesearchaeota archaeon]|nr:bifunctional methylenetetrahydrofolate dehydrogenase/methenyltetrahydrofolate cyclohydrolase [Candidatus Woesearchaeota archaeon]
MAILIDGKAVAKTIIEQVRERVSSLKVKPCLAIV